MIRYVIFGCEDILILNKFHHHDRNKQFTYGISFNEEDMSVCEDMKAFINEICAVYPETAFKCFVGDSLTSAKKLKKLYLVKHYGYVFKENSHGVVGEKTKITYLQTFCKEHDIDTGEILYIDSNGNFIRKIYDLGFKVALPQEIIAAGGYIDINQYNWNMRYCEYRINIDNVGKINRFVSAIQKIKADFKIRSGNCSIDAKSIMGIFSIDTGTNLELFVVAPNLDTRCQIEHMIKPFIAGDV